MTGTDMLFRGLLLSVALLAAGITSASADMRISSDRGGQIGQYLQNFTLVRSNGENVIVDGDCLSACTLVLGLIPPSHICATSRARFGFHAAWMPDAGGRPVTSPLGTQALWNIYPGNVRNWITHHGGLSRHMIYMQGRSLNGIVASCERPMQRSAQRRLERRYAVHSVRYAPGDAASDRR